MNDFLKQFRPNIKADPVSSLKGVINFIVAFFVYYAANKGMIPQVVSWPIIAKAVTDGLHALGVNNITQSQLTTIISCCQEKEEPAPQK